MSKTKVAATALLWLVAGWSSGCGDDSTPGTPQTRAPAAEKPHPRPDGPPNALTQTLDELDPFVRIPRLAEVLGDLGPENASDAAAALIDRRLTLGAPEVELLVRFWARYEPRPATIWAVRSSAPGYRGGAILPAIEVYARSDPWGAAEFARAMRVSGSDYTQIADIGLIRGWYDGGIAGLEDYVRSLGPSIERQRAVAGWARRMALVEGAAAAMAWAREISEEERRFKLAVYRQLGSVLAQIDSQAAVAWCDEVCDGPFGDGVSTMIATRWAADDGAAAMAWVSQRPPGPERDKAVRGAFRGWWRKDSDGMQVWAAERNRDGVPPWFQPALELYAAAVAGSGEPEEGMKWALLIEDDETRRGSSMNVALKWRRIDEEAAEEWLADSDLSEVDRDRVRDPKKFKGVPLLPLGEAAPGADPQ